jgi:phytoene/squalene synthetase
VSETLPSLVRTHDYERYLCTLFAPAKARLALWAVLALGYELFRVPATVSEEMVGLVRLKWWQERLAALALGTDNRVEHPTLAWIAPVMLTGDVPLKLLDALLEALAEQMHRPTDSAPIVEAMRVLYRLLAYAAHEPQHYEAYAMAGEMQAHIALLRSAIARGEGEGRLRVLSKALGAMPSASATSSRFLQRLQRLNALWCQRLNAAAPLSGTSISPIPLLALRLWI